MLNDSYLKTLFRNIIGDEYLSVILMEAPDDLNRRGLCKYLWFWFLDKSVKKREVMTNISLSVLVAGRLVLWEGEEYGQRRFWKEALDVGAPGIQVSIVFNGIPKEYQCETF